jgi:hypothetical protein
LSFAVAVNVTVLPDGEVVFWVMSPGTLTTGGVVSVSVTTTWNDAEPVLPCESVAVQVTVVLPIGKVDPEAGEQDGVIGPSTLSFADAEYVSVFPPGEVVLSWMSLGTVTTGGVVSVNVIVTWNDPEPVLPCESVAVQFTVVVPTGKVEPELGEQDGVIDPSTASCADAE